jgi:protease-4
MGSTAASGGYYIAMGADEIWAEETTISGSIGVGAMFPTFQRSLESLGVNIDGFGTSNLTGQLSPMRELGDEARLLMDISVRSAYDVFIGKVADARSLDVTRVDEIAQGRVWIGTDAYKVGLVDSLGGVDQAIASAAIQAGLAEGEYEVSYIEREMSMAEKILLQYARLLGALLGSADAPADSASLAVSSLLDSLRAEFNVLNTWNDPRGIYYHCMCELH